MGTESSLADVLLDPGRDHLEGVEGSPELAEVKSSLVRLAPSIPWSAARTEIDNAVRDALDVKLDEVLVSAWLRSALLVRYLDSSKYPADQTVLAHLAEHTVKTTLRPSIKVYLQEVLATTIPMEVQLSLVLKGFILAIKGGKVLRVTSGSCQAKGKVTLSGIVLADKASKTVDLPGVISFGEGRSIPTAAAV